MYLPQLNTFAIREFQTRYAAEEVARFLHHACQGLPLKSSGHFPGQSEDNVYAETLEHALAHLGSQILCRRGGRLSGSKAKDRDHASSHVSMDGRLLGQGLYSAYERGLLSRSDLRRIFLVSIKEPAKARDFCAQLSRKVLLTE